MIAQSIFWGAVVAVVIAHRYILRSAVAASAPATHGHTLPPIKRVAELLWVLIPAVSLVVLLVATWRAIGDPSTAIAGGGVVPTVVIP
jgi:heme/copper-type cytochrome/quinol oxidase subunit 2